MRNFINGLVLSVFGSIFVGAAGRALDFPFGATLFACALWGWLAMEIMDTRRGN